MASRDDGRPTRSYGDRSRAQGRTEAYATPPATQSGGPGGNFGAAAKPPGPKDAKSLGTLEGLG